MSDEVCLQVVDLYLAERKRGAAGGNLSSQCVRAAWETSYQWKAERVMAEENCFKVSTASLVNVEVDCLCGLDTLLLFEEEKMFSVIILHFGCSGNMLFIPVQ